MENCYEILVNKKKIKESKYLQIKGTCNFYMVIDLMGNVGTHLSTLKIKCFQDSSKKKRLLARNVFQRLDPETQEIEKTFKGVSEKIVLATTDVNKSIVATIKPMKK